MKRNKLLHATIWMNFTDIILSERSKSQNTHHFWERWTGRKPGGMFLGYFGNALYLHLGDVDINLFVYKNVLSHTLKISGLCLIYLHYTSV